MPALFAATPTLEIDGHAQPALTALVTRIVIDQNVRGTATASVELNNLDPTRRGHALAVDDRTDVDFGQGMTIGIGHGHDRLELFDGVVIGLRTSVDGQHPPNFTILARDRLESLRGGHRTLAIHDHDDLELTEQLFNEHDIDFDIDIDAEPTHHDVLARHAQTDHEFLLDRAAGLDADLVTGRATTLLSSRTGSGGNAIALRLAENLLDIELTADSTDQRTTASTLGWSVEQGDELRADVTYTELAGALSGAHGGGAISEQAFGARPTILDRGAVAVADAAERIATAELRGRGRRFVTGHGTAIGSAELRAGADVELLGVGKLFAGRYHVTSVRHVIDGTDGWRTQFEIEGSELGR